MPLETTAEATALLRLLDALLERELRTATGEAITRARENLAASQGPFAWAVIDPSAAQLPSGIESAWVFVIDSRAQPEPHRHPNSIQHLRSLEGEGRVVLSGEGSSERREFVLGANRRWLVIARDVVHAVRSTSAAEWVVASFHTVSADQVLEVASAGERRYE